MDIDGWKYVNPQCERGRSLGLPGKVCLFCLFRDRDKRSALSKLQINTLRIKAVRNHPFDPCRFKIKRFPLHTLHRDSQSLILHQLLNP